MKILHWGCWLMAFIILSSTGRAQSNLMPEPARVTPGQGRLKIDSSFRIALTGYAEPRLERAAQRMIHHLERTTGLILSTELAPTASPATLIIATTAASAPVQKLGEDESYELVVTPAQARLAAPNPLGALHGMETFLQLVEADRDSFAAPAVRIEDQPRFPWRGLMMDVSRHWMPVEVVKRNLDAMAAVKLNVLHWHLSDDQGFRVESQRYPEAARDGLRRALLHAGSRSAT